MRKIVLIFSLLSVICMTACSGTSDNNNWGTEETSGSTLTSDSLTKLLLKDANISTEAKYCNI